jgi:hypothetical protein
MKTTLWRSCTGQGAAHLGLVSQHTNGVVSPAKDLPDEDLPDENTAAKYHGAYYKRPALPLARTQSQDTSTCSTTERERTTVRRPA